VSGSRRLDIQGLRAVAVLLVVAFHAGLPVPGGFVGVDVFFVISGFVITGMIHRERSSTGRFSFGRFYLRRFKRLTPALALMVGVTMVLAFLLLSPFGTQQQAAQTGIGAMLLVANFVIAQSTGDYFAPPAGSNPLLHTWSLSVEEQFYLMFPAVLLFGWVLSQRARRIPWLRARQIPWVTVLVGTAALISFWLAMAGVSALGPLAPSATYLVGFYAPFTRAWEFAAGALLALATTSRGLRSGRHTQVVAWLGAALLAASASMINATTPFPGPWTLLPVGGTLLLIAAGTHQTTWVNRALALPAMAKAGDWSYSIYLWHWPLRVFAVYLWPQAPFAAVLAVTLSILPAVASYRWVEQPIRRLPPLRPRRTLGLVGVVVSPALLLAATVDTAAANYWIPRYKSGTLSAYQGDTGWTDFERYLDNTYYACSDQVFNDGARKWGGVNNCHQSKPVSRIDVAIIGDSHAEALFLGLADALSNKNVVYYTRDGLPLRSVTGLAEIIDDVASNPAIGTVIVTAAWGARPAPKVGELAGTLEAFRSKGKAVFVTDDVPTFYFDAVACKYRKAPILPSAVLCSEDRRVFEAQYATYYPELREAVDKVLGVQLLNTAAYFCNSDVCSMTKGKALLYRDSNHVNIIGSRFLANRMLADFPQFRSAINQS
jgi:peptidoglycan/LPS O-acetylase OafA/YrhL